MNFLEIFAECSITFAGFGALHAMLQGSTGQRGTLRAFSTVTPGVFGFMLAMLPILLAESGLDGDRIFRLSAWLGVLLCGALAGANIWFDYRFSSRGIPPQATYTIRLAQCLALTSTALMLYVALAQPRPFYYSLALALLLMQGVLALLHSFFRAVNTELEKL